MAGGLAQAMEDITEQRVLEILRDDDRGDRGGDRGGRRGQPLAEVDLVLLRWNIAARRSVVRHLIGTQGCAPGLESRRKEWAAEYFSGCWAFLFR